MLCWAGKSVAHNCLDSFETAKLGGELEVALVVVPGPKSFAGKMVEAAIEKSGVEGLKKAIRDKEIRTGVGADITNQKAIELADTYRQDGRHIWNE